MWTEEQQSIIEARKKNLIISAAAGSGKTAVLIERLFRLIVEDQVTVDEILMITFTNKAAKEMKERLEQKLEAALIENPENHFLREQLEALDGSYISTIHSFCKQGIEEHFQKLPIDLNFKMLDEKEMTQLIDEALTQVLEEAYELKNPLFFKLLDTYGRLESDEGLRATIKSLYNFSQGAPFPKTWLEEKNHYLDGSMEAFLNNPLGKSFMDILFRELERIQFLNQRARVVAGQEALEYEAIAEEDGRLLEALRESFRTEPIETFFLKTKITFPKLPSVKKENQTEGHLRFKSLRDNYKKLLGSLAFDFPIHLEILDKVRVENEYLIGLIDGLSQHYGQLKREKNLLDFNDLEHFMIELLEDSEVCQYYKNQFTYIFVDEFQDSNLAQERIVTQIARTDNLFFVGDLKQSIYRFRLADASIFLRTLSAYEADAQSEAIPLNKNFRCSLGIVNGVNSLFNQLMDGKQTPLNYRMEGQLVHGSSIQNTHPIETIVVNRDIGMEAGESGQDRIYREAHVCAEKIQSLMAEETPLEGGDDRLLSYGDIAILMFSSKKALPIYLEVFEAYGIPLYGEVDTGFFESESVALFLDLLRIINNKKEDLSLLNVLKSPLFNFTLEELGQIRQVGIREKSFCEALYSYPDSGPLGEKIQGFKQRLETYQKEVEHYSLSGFLSYLLSDTQFYYLLFGYERGDQEGANVRELLYMAEDYEMDHEDHLRGFLEYFSYMEQEALALGEASTISDNGDVVKLLTLHKSKGLEFPVVFLTALGNEFRHPNKTPLVTHPYLGIGPIYLNENQTVKTLAHFIIEKTKGRESVEDHLNLLYVGMTRGKQQLFLVGSMKKLEQHKSQWQEGAWLDLQKCRSFYELLLPFAYYDESTQPFFDIQETDLEIPVIEGIKPVIQIQEAPTQVINSKDFLPLPRPIPRKVSVTELHQGKGEDLMAKDFLKGDLKVRPEFLRDTPMTAVEKGILFHLVMEYLDYYSVKDRKGVEDYLDRLELEGILLPEEREAVNIEHVIGFIESSIGQRVGRSLSYESEKAFNYKLSPKVFLKGYEGDGKTLLQGVIDLYFEEPDGYVLVDFKTDYLGEEALEASVEGYREQVLLYGEAFEAIKGKPIKEAYLYFSSMNKCLLVKGKEEE